MRRGASLPAERRGAGTKAADYLTGRSSRPTALEGPGACEARHRGEDEGPRAEGGSGRRARPEGHDGLQDRRAAEGGAVPHVAGVVHYRRVAGWRRLDRRSPGLDRPQPGGGQLLSGNLARREGRGVGRHEEDPSAGPGGGTGSIGEEHLIGDHDAHAAAPGLKDPWPAARGGIAGNGVDVAEVADEATKRDV